MAENINELIKKAEEFFNQKKFEDINLLLTDTLLEEQKNAELYAWKALVYYKLGIDDSVSMNLAKKAIEIDSNCFMGYFISACVWRIKEEYDKSIADYNTAININPDYADAYYYRGLVWQSKKEKEKAIADFDNAIKNYTKVINNNLDDAELFVWIGLAYYAKKDYSKAIDNYDAAIRINPNYDLAFYNKGNAWVAKKDYGEALKSFTTAISFNSQYVDKYYTARGNILSMEGKYNDAILDYNRAIKKNPNDENPYYKRGLTYYRKALKEDNDNIKSLNESKKDFKKYLKRTSKENNDGIIYAKQYIDELTVVIRDQDLWSIKQLVDKIKGILLIKEKYITHYTSLSTIKDLIIDGNKFRISEGNFMNDPSEGIGFYRFLYGKDRNAKEETTEEELFIPKPFIGSFVPEDKYNSLNMWRFYGKENGIEAKGCAIVLNAQQFIDDIKSFSSNEKNKEARIDYESDINFYQVVYLPHKSTDFKNPKLKSKKFKDFKDMMFKLKEKVNSYDGVNKSNLKEYLNNIAFLFKRDDYENENEVRLVMTGIGFKKKFYKEKKVDKSINPPRVYIKLAPIRTSIEKITLGPKVDKANEWASALHYTYIGEDKIPEIIISHLPYK